MSPFNTIRPTVTVGIIPKTKCQCGNFKVAHFSHSLLLQKYFATQLMHFGSIGSNIFYTFCEFYSVNLFYTFFSCIIFNTIIYLILYILYYTII